MSVAIVLRDNGVRLKGVRHKVVSVGHTVFINDLEINLEGRPALFKSSLFEETASVALTWWISFLAGPAAIA